MGEIKKLNFINIDKVDDKSLAAAKLLVEKKLIKIAYGEKTIYFKLEYYKDINDLSYGFINFLIKIKKLKYVFDSKSTL